MSRSRLLDQVLAQSNPGDTLTAPLRGATAVLADNVSKYLFEGTDQDLWDELKDFPNVAPPYPTLWIEFPLQNRCRTEKGVTATPGGDRTVFGFLVQSTEVDASASLELPSDEEILRRTPKNLLAGVLAAGGLEALRRHVASPEFQAQHAAYLESVRWQCQVWAWRSFDGVLELGAIPEAAFSYAVGADGAMRAMPWLPGKSAIFGGPTAPYVECCLRAGVHPFNGMTAEAWFGMFRSAFNIPLLALCFMHCKNVEVAPQGDPPSRKKNRHKPPRSGVRFHVLEIEPMRQVLRREGQADETGLRRALHLCRGHFKTYNGRGLFGREALKGTFWFPMHARGTSSRGVVQKDYAVSAPGAST